MQRVKKVLIAGCGDIGTLLGLQLAAVGYQLWGLRRQGQLPVPIHTINADVTHPHSLAELTGQVFDYVIVTLTPEDFTDKAYQRVYVDGLRNLLAKLSQPQLIKRLLFVSSTSVYQQGGGQWVDEDAVTEPIGFSGRRLLEAEQLLVSSGIRCTVIRFAGIYGPGRHRLIEQVRAGQGCPHQPPVYTNRIHRDDCVGLLGHLINRDASGETVEPCYIGVDSEPVTLWGIKQWLAQRLTINSAELTEGLVNRRSSKRCSNQRMLASGYQLKYPGFREGYSAVLEAM